VSQSDTFPPKGVFFLLPPDDVLSVSLPLLQRVVPQKDGNSGMFTTKKNLTEIAKTATQASSVKTDERERESGGHSNATKPKSTQRHRKHTLGRNQHSAFLKRSFSLIISLIKSPEIRNCLQKIERKIEEFFTNYFTNLVPGDQKLP
jgi:hypothetical protein